MSPVLLADVVLVIHLLFVVFVVTGGLLGLKWPRVAWLHLPAVGWGVFVELSGGMCPLTPLENRLRVEAGQALYAGDFVERYVAPVLYPDDLRRDVQIALGVIAVAVNLVIYWRIWHRSHRTHRK